MQLRFGSPHTNGTSWSQTNSYDPYGNRSIVEGGLSFSASNNRITNAGYVYDAAGNLTNDGTQSFAFDAENKIKTVNGESDVYRYDGDGNRVRKNFTNSEKVRMIYSGGQMIAEYDLSNGSLKKEYVYGAKGLIATIEATNGTRYTTADHLGTPRVVTNSSAGVVSRHDYMPFGEEIGAGIGGRNTGMGFSVADGLRQKFTSKERDNETGLDYFLARYFSSTQGRFTTADDPFADQMPHDPQSWNLYTYVRNNPLRATDPDGRKMDGDLLEKLRNLLGGFGFQTDAQVKAETERRRCEIRHMTDQTTTPGYVQVTNVESGASYAYGVESLSPSQVWDFSNRLRTGDFDVVVGQEARDLMGVPQLGAPTGSTLGNDLKNVRKLESGRLKGYSRGNTNLPGGEQAAKEMFRQQTGRDPVGTYDRVVQGGKEFVFRSGSASRSGTSKVEIVDHAKKFLEKISFKK